MGKPICTYQAKFIAAGVTLLALFLGFTFTANERLYGEGKVTTNLYVFCVILAFCNIVASYILMHVLVEHRIKSLRAEFKAKKAEDVIDAEQDLQELKTEIPLGYAIFLVMWYSLVMSATESQIQFIGFIALILFLMAAVVVIVRAYREHRAVMELKKSA